MRPKSISPRASARPGARRSRTFAASASRSFSPFSVNPRTISCSRGVNLTWPSCPQHAAPRGPGQAPASLLLPSLAAPLCLQPCTLSRSPAIFILRSAPSPERRANGALGEAIRSRTHPTEPPALVPPACGREARPMSHSTPLFLPHADRNLLLGVLALQAGLIDPAQLAEVCPAWAAERARPLAELLVERGWLSPADRARLERSL